MIRATIRRPVTTADQVEQFGNYECGIAGYAAKQGDIPPVRDSINMIEADVRGLEAVVNLIEGSLIGDRPMQNAVEGQPGLQETISGRLYAIAGRSNALVERLRILRKEIG